MTNPSSNCKAANADEILVLKVIRDWLTTRSRKLKGSFAAEEA